MKKRKFDTVNTFKEIETKISNDIQGMNFEQLIAYLEKAKLKAQN